MSQLAWYGSAVSGHAGLLHRPCHPAGCSRDVDELTIIYMLCCCLQGGETRKDQMAEEHGGDASAGYSEMGHQVHLPH
jgi:hypothetical protein